MRRLIALLAVTTIVALSGIVFAGMALAQTTTTAPTATTRPPVGAAPPAAGAVTTTTRPAGAATTTTRPAGAATAPAQARTGARTDMEVTLAGVAFVVGGALLFFGQPLRRARRQA